jgi:hypothetical protein
MLQMLCGLGPKQQNYLITGDETWIFWNNDHRGICAQDREDVPVNTKKMISSRKTMLSAYFSRTGFISLESLPQRQKYNSQFFAETILPSLAENLSVCPPKLKSTAAYLLIESAKLHNSRLSIPKPEEYGFIRVPQPPYSPELAPCDFVLFGHLKSQLENETFSTRTM